jgi:hypothetical protein
MGLLTKLFGERKDSLVVEAECRHGHLLPRWDSAEDIGHEARASHFMCESCGETFSPAEAETLRAAAIARLRNN